MSGYSTCPKCGCNRVLGEYASFLVPLDADGNQDGEWRDYESSTELTDKRMCPRCYHEWEAE